MPAEHDTILPRESVAWPDHVVVLQLEEEEGRVGGGLDLYLDGHLLPYKVVLSTY